MRRIVQDENRVDLVLSIRRGLNDLNGWIVTADALPNGDLLTVTATDAKEIQHIRGLGFIGLLRAVRITSRTSLRWQRASSTITRPTSTDT